jgi:hypothetical protein
MNERLASAGRLAVTGSAGACGRSRPPPDIPIGKSDPKISKRDCAQARV